MGRKRKGNNDIPARVYWHRNQWQYKAREDERLVLGKVWTPLGSDLPTMYYKYADIKEILSNAGGMDKLLTRFERDVLLAPQNPANYKDRTIKDKSVHISKLRPVFGHMNPSSIRPTHCAQYLDKRGLQSRSQANQEFNTLSAVFNWAVRWGVVDRNPCKGLSRLKVGSRSRSPTIAELEAFKEVSSDFIKCWVDFKYMTGLRRKDILELKIDQCDIKGEGIHIKTSKTNKRGLIEWNSDLINCVERIKIINKIQGDTLFCDSRGGPIHVDNFKSRWRRAMKNALKVGAIASSFWEHDIRSRFAIESEKRGIDATNQLLHDNPKQKEAYLREKKQIKVTPLTLSGD